MPTEQPPPARASAASSRRRPVATAASFLWSAAPLLTFGLGTWAVFLYAAIRRRSVRLGAAAGLYAVLLIVFGIAETPAHPSPLASSIGFVSADELSGALGLSPYAVADLADHTVYVP